MPIHKRFPSIPSILPPEILDLILDTIYHDWNIEERDRSHSGGIYSASTEWVANASNPSHPDSFPFYLCRISKAWADRIARHPRYVTRVFVYLDLSSTFDLLSDALATSATKEQPFDFFLMWNILKPNVLESQAMEKVKAIVRPHVGRLRSAHCQVLHLGNAPEFPPVEWLAPFASPDRYITVTTPPLTKVYTRSPHGDVVSTLLWHTPPECTGSSFLTLLSGEGANYARLGETGKTWTIRYWDPALEPNVTTEELLQGLSSLGPLDELKLDHVVLNSPMAQDDEEEWCIAPRRLTLTHIDAQSLVALFDIVDRGFHRFPSLTLINCALCAVPSVLSTQLTLQNIRPQFDLVGFLRCWDGEILQIKDCPGFTTKTLRVFTKLGGESHSGAPSLRRLVIEGCPGVTEEGLKDFIRLRKKIDDARVWEVSKTPLALTSLEVVSDHPLEEEDLQWFAEEAHNICWKSPGQVQRLCGWLRREPLSETNVGHFLRNAPAELNIISGFQEQVPHFRPSFDDDVLGVNLDLHEGYDGAAIHRAQSPLQAVEDIIVDSESSEDIEEFFLDLDIYSDSVSTLSSQLCLFD